MEHGLTTFHRLVRFRFLVFWARRQEVLELDVLGTRNASDKEHELGEPGFLAILPLLPLLNGSGEVGGR